MSGSRSCSKHVEQLVLIGKRQPWISLSLDEQSSYDLGARAVPPCGKSVEARCVRLRQPHPEPCLQAHAPFRAPFVCTMQGARISTVIRPACVVLVPITVTPQFSG